MPVTDATLITLLPTTADERVENLTTLQSVIDILFVIGE
jgi:hypothetical protein